VTATKADTSIPEPRRRWYQFSLRTLLVATAVIALACSVLSVKFKQAHNQQRAIAELRKLAVLPGHTGLGVGYDYGDEYESQCEDSVLMGGPNPAPKKPYPEWLADLLGEDFLYNVGTVFLNGAQLSDTDLVHLEGLTVKEVYLDYTQIGDAALRHVKEVNGLKTLEIDHTKVTDEGLVHLRELNTLRILALPRGVTDAGLAHLEGLTSLKQLYLRGPGITDAGLKHLKGLTRLEHLSLRDTSVTESGIKELKKVSPRVQVVH
jgi:hypothetical protein